MRTRMTAGALALLAATLVSFGSAGTAHAEGDTVRTDPVSAAMTAAAPAPNMYINNDGSDNNSGRDFLSMIICSLNKIANPKYICVG